MSKKILITGASGFIGGRIASALAQDGNVSLYVLQRESGRGGRLFGKSARIIEGDITRQESIRDALNGMDIVIHCAALMSNFDDEPRRRFREVNVIGTENLLKCLDLRSLKQFIHISSVGVYGQTMNRPVGEDAPYGGCLSDYEWSKKESELAVLKYAGEKNIPFTILRLSQVYGAGMRYGWPQTIKSIKDNNMLVPGPARAKIHLLNIDDLLKAVMLVLDNGKAMNKIYNIAGPEISSLGGVFDMISDILQVRRPPRVPYFAVYLASLFLSLIPYPLKTERLRLLTPHRVRFFACDHMYDISSIAGELGYAPTVKLRDGFSAMIAWCGQEGSI